MNNKRFIILIIILCLRSTFKSTVLVIYYRCQRGLICPDNVALFKSAGAMLNLTGLQEKLSLNTEAIWIMYRPLRFGM